MPTEELKAKETMIEGMAATTTEVRAVATEIGIGETTIEVREVVAATVVAIAAAKEKVVAKTRAKKEPRYSWAACRTTPPRRSSERSSRAWGRW